MKVLLKYQLVLLFSILILFSSVTSHADEKLPDSLTAALLLKLAEYNKTLQEQKAIQVLILNNRTIESFLKKKIDTIIGQSRLLNVASTLDSPNDRPYHIVYTDQPADLKKLQHQHWYQDESVMTVTANSALIKKGFVVHLFDNEGVPGITLNLSASHDKKLQWSPQILDFVNLLD